MLNFRQIQVFVAVFESGSFSKAAQRIHATQPGLSIQIRALEKTLGTSLFRRTSKGVEPTQSGSRLYRQVNSILHDLNVAERDVKQLSGTISGTIRVGLMPAFTSGVLVPTLTEFIERYPEVEINILEAFSPALTDAIVNRDLDFAIVPTEQVSREIKPSHFGTDWELLVSRTASDLHHLKAVDLTNLPPLRLVLPTRGNVRRDYLDTFFALHGIPIDSVLELDAMIATLNLVACTNWMTIVPATICLGDMDGQRRKLHPIRFPAIHVDYMLIEPQQTTLPQAAKLFADALKEQFNATHRQWDHVLEHV